MDGKVIASKRKQAERNVQAHIDEILSSLAEDIADAANGVRVPSSLTVFSRTVRTKANSSISKAKENIDAYIVEYSKASISIVGDKDTGAVGRILRSNIFGRTFRDRSESYMEYFFNDVVKILFAAKRMKMSDDDAKSTALSEYKDPYVGGVISKASAAGERIDTPSYGRGVYRSAYQNIVRNAQGTVAIAWSKEEYNYARRNGAIGFIPHRGSTYPCELCDSHAERFHKMNDKNDPPPLYHSRCCCWVTYVFDEKDIMKNKE